MIRKTRRPAAVNMLRPVAWTVDARGDGCDQAMGVLRSAAQELAVRLQYTTSEQVEHLVPGEVFPELHVIIQDTRLLYDPAYMEEAYRLTAQLTQCGRRAEIRVTMVTESAGMTWTVKEPARSALDVMAAVSAAAIAADPAIGVQIVQTAILEADPGPEAVTAVLAGKTAVDWGTGVASSREFREDRRRKMDVIHTKVRGLLDDANVLQKLPTEMLLVSDGAAVELFGDGFRVGLVQRAGIPATTDGGQR